MRVLRIHSWDGQPGGAEEMIRTVSLRLEAAGHPQRIVELVDRPPAGATPLERPLEVPSGGWARLRSDLWGNPRIVRFLTDAYREFRPDIVHLHHYDAGFASIAEALGGFPAPLVFTAHDAELVCPISTLVRPGNVICDGGIRFRCLTTGCEVGWAGGPYNLWQRRSFDKHVAPRVRAYLAPSRSIQGYLERNGYAPAVLIPSFAELPPAATAELAMPPAPSPRVIGFIGRLEPYKGVQFLLPAVAALAKEFPDLRVRVAGEGSYRGELERLSVRLGIADRVEWLGACRGPEKERFYRGIHLLAVPSNVFENFGLVALEALAWGRPVVATDIGGLPDIVRDGESGRLVPIADTPALTAAVRELLLDPARAGRLGAAGRARVLREFAPELHLERLLALYTTVLSGAPVPPGSEGDALRRPSSAAKARGPAQWEPEPATPFPVYQK
jgi:glycosyltransferase involved in cell wall biosynthesis